MAAGGLSLVADARGLREAGAEAALQFLLASLRSSATF